MIHPLNNRSFEAMESRALQPPPRTASAFADLFGSATTPATRTATRPADSVADPTRTLPGSQPVLGKPDVQGFLTTFYAQRAAETSTPGGAMSASTPFQAPAAAPTIWSPDDPYGPDQIFQQAISNQCANAFASLTGTDPATITAQLPGIPTTQAQQQFDSWLAQSNAQRLASGQPIDTGAYWSDPGPVTLNGVTYTSQQLGYCGPGQSSGPEPIFISIADQVGPDTYTVGGYQGTVKGIQPGRYYTLQQLEQAGLPSGQADTRFYPGSWTQSA